MRNSLNNRKLNPQKADKIIYPQNLTNSFYNMKSQDNYERTKLEYLLPTKIYNLNFSVPLHKAVKLYYYKIGLITHNPDWNCSNYLPEGSIKDSLKTKWNCNFRKTPPDEIFNYYHQFGKSTPALLIKRK